MRQAAKSAASFNSAFIFDLKRRKVKTSGIDGREAKQRSFRIPHSAGPFATLPPKRFFKRNGHESRMLTGGSMNFIRSKERGRVSLSAWVAITTGGVLLSWAYRRWNRRKSAHSHTGRKPDVDVQANADRLSGKFLSLDEVAQSGQIPKDLEKEPKNLDQSIHRD